MQLDPTGQYLVVNRAGLPTQPYAYPSEYGLRTCAAHDVMVPPQCDSTSPSNPGVYDPARNHPTCSYMWCFIDPTVCNVAYSEYAHSLGSQSLHLSYAACANENANNPYFIAIQPRAPPPSTPPSPPASPPFVAGGSSTSTGGEPSDTTPPAAAMAASRCIAATSCGWSSVRTFESWCSRSPCTRRLSSSACSAGLARSQGAS